MSAGASHGVQDSSVASPVLSVVIPAFNEAPRILETVALVTSYLAGQGYTWEVLVVDDGSSDGTGYLVSESTGTDPRVRVMSIAHGGKGLAVKLGMLNTTGRYRFMCDADLAMPIEYLGRFMDRMGEGFDLVIASRQKPGARRIGEPWVGHARGRVFNWVVRLLAVRGFDDTQCGFKCFRGEVADELFRLQRTNGLGFDVEVLYLAVQRGLRILEMPIDWYHREGSKVRPLLEPVLMFRDVARVRIWDLAGRYES